jgi:hypothetical protein
VKKEMKVGARINSLAILENGDLVCASNLFLHPYLATLTRYLTLIIIFRPLFLFLHPYFATLTRYLTLIFIFTPLFCHPYKIFDPYFYFQTLILPPLQDI